MIYFSFIYEGVSSIDCEVKDWESGRGQTTYDAIFRLIIKHKFRVIPMKYVHLLFHKELTSSMNKDYS